MSRASRYTLHASHPRDTRDLGSFRRPSLWHNKGCTFPSCIIPKRCACLDAAVRRISSRALLIVTRGRKRSGKGIHRAPVRKGKRATQQPARRLREGSNFDSGTPPPPSPPPHPPPRGPFSIDTRANVGSWLHLPSSTHVRRILRDSKCLR